MHRFFAASLLAVVVIAGCDKKDDDDKPAAAVAPVAENGDSVKAKIEAANANFQTAMQKGDTAHFGDNYAADAIVFMPGMPQWETRDSIQKNFTGFMKQYTMKDPKIETSKVVVSGDLAVENGTYDWTIQPKNGKPVHDNGKYVTVWQKQADGSWKIIRDINNSSVAM